jgi:tyrosyl-tRNA synthetase
MASRALRLLSTPTCGPGQIRISSRLVPGFLCPQQHIRSISQTRQEKITKAEEQWAGKAEAMRAGELNNVWDVFNERGLVKDVAGY